jgi:hypothetical protein
MSKVDDLREELTKCCSKIAIGIDELPGKKIVCVSNTSSGLVLEFDDSTLCILGIGTDWDGSAEVCVHNVRGPLPIEVAGKLMSEEAYDNYIELFDKWEEAVDEERELAEYRRLRAKFEKNPDRDQVVTITRIYDCNCDGNYIHTEEELPLVNGVRKCIKCNTELEDMPNSRLNEIKDLRPELLTAFGWEE